MSDGVNKSATNPGGHLYLHPPVVLELIYPGAQHHNLYLLLGDTHLHFLFINSSRTKVFPLH